jgi:DNA-binding transcriptional ArsR family regulator
MSPETIDHTEESSAMDAVFTALSHRARRQILLALRGHDGRMTAGQIAQRFSHTWPTTTRHLRVLEAAGLVRVEKFGRGRAYHLETHLLTHVTRTWLRWFEEGV